MGKLLEQNTNKKRSVNVKSNKGPLTKVRWDIVRQEQNTEVLKIRHLVTKAKSNFNIAKQRIHVKVLCRR